MQDKRSIKVIFAEAAKRDLVEIARYIAHDNPAQARRVAKELRDRALDLAEYPEAFARMPDLVERSFRRRVVGRYIIVFRLQGEHVNIVRVLHAARDVANLLDLPE